MYKPNRSHLKGLLLAKAVAEAEKLYPSEQGLFYALQQLINEAEQSVIGCDEASELRYVANQLREAGAAVPPEPLNEGEQSAIIFGMSTALLLIERRLSDLD